MSDYYRDKIKVVSVDMMCFPVDPVTLDALSTGCYDPYAWCHQDNAIKVISHSEWVNRRNEQWDKQRDAELMKNGSNRRLNVIRKTFSDELKR